MIKPENIIEKREKGSYRIRCERCGETFVRARIDRRLNPLCCRCWRDNERKRVKERAEAKKKADYEKAFNDGYVKGATEIITKFFAEEPCNYNCMDELTDDWCCEHCDNHTVRECWEHAIAANWHMKFGYEVEE